MKDIYDVWGAALGSLVGNPTKWGLGCGMMHSEVCKAFISSSKRKVVVVLMSTVLCVHGVSKKDERMSLYYSF